MNAPRLAPLVATVALLALAACSSGGSSSDATPPKATSTTVATGASTTTSTVAASTTSTTEAPDSTTSTTVTGTQPDGQTTPGLGSLAEGVHYGYFTGVSDGVVEGQQVQVVAFDKVEFLTGDAAVQAAIAHGDAEPGATSIDDDYYIVNDNTSLRLLPVIPDGVVSVIRDGSPDPVPGSSTRPSPCPTSTRSRSWWCAGISLITATEGVFLP